MPTAYEMAARERDDYAHTLAQVTKERDMLRDALKNMMGAFDNAVCRRRYPPDDFMQECIKSGRAALAPETAS